MGVRLDRTCGADKHVAVNDRGVRPCAQCRIDAVHDVGITGLADAHELAVANADVRLHDPLDGINDCGVVHDGVERAGGIGAGGLKTLAVAHRLAGAGSELVAVAGEVPLDLGQKRSVAEAHHIAGRRAENFSIVTACQHGHGSGSPVVLGASQCKAGLPAVFGPCRAIY